MLYVSSARGQYRHERKDDMGKKTVQLYNERIEGTMPTSMTNCAQDNSKAVWVRLHKTHLNNGCVVYILHVCSNNGTPWRDYCFPTHQHDYEFSTFKAFEENPEEYVG